MFTLSDRRCDRHCQGFSRREFLRVGSLSLGGLGFGSLGLGSLSLADLFAAQANDSSGRSSLTGKSVVLLFLQGGPSHIEFFDPKMDAPSDIRSITGELQTALPGITFGGTFPKLARLADRLAIVRSYASGNGDHSYLSVTSGRNPMKAAMGSIYAKIAGANHPVSGMPSNTLLLPEAVQDGLKLGRNFESDALPTLTSSGELGPACAAFDPSGGGDLKANMELKIAPERLTDRRHLLSRLDQFRRHVDGAASWEGVDRFRQQAFDVIAGGIAEAFDLAKEDSATLERYDTSRLFRAEEIQKYYDMKRATNLLGRQMLLARRLCEAGCGFVTVSDCGWDMHANSNSPKQMAGIWPLAGQVDHAVSAFIEDLAQRGLSDKILLVVTGEMGRTPRINKNGGRDHWGNLTSLLLAGGGLRMGQVIGQSDRQASEPASDPYNPSNLMATVMHTLFDIGQLRLAVGVPREIIRFAEEHKPIGPLMA